MIGLENDIVPNPSSCPRALRHSSSFSITWNTATALRRQLGCELAGFGRDGVREEPLTSEREHCHR